MNLILKWYRRDSKVIHKMTSEESIEAYSFNSSEKVEKILKNEMTNATLKYFEEHGNKDAQAITKGTALAYRLLLDGHRKAKYIQGKFKNKETRKKVWNNYKLNSWNGDQPK